MDRQQKAAVIDEVAAQIQEAEAIYAIDYRGASVPQAAELRARLRDADATGVMTLYPEGAPSKAVPISVAAHSRAEVVVSEQVKAPWAAALVEVTGQGQYPAQGRLRDQQALALRIVAPIVGGGPGFDLHVRSITIDRAPQVALQQ